MLKEITIPKIFLAPFSAFMQFGTRRKGSGPLTLRGFLGSDVTTALIFICFYICAIFEIGYLFNFEVPAEKYQEVVFMYVTRNTSDGAGLHGAIESAMLDGKITTFEFCWVRTLYEWNIID